MESSCAVPAGLVPMRSHAVATRERPLMSRQQRRSPGDGAIDPALAQKKRARHRLVGAVCLCLLAALIVPLVLESEPRPSRDLPLEIAAAPGTQPEQQSPAPAEPRAGGPAASGTIAPRAEVPGGEPLSAVAAVTAPTAPIAPAAPDAARPAEPVQPPQAVAPPARPESRSEPARAERGDKPDARRAQRDGTAKPDPAREAAKAPAQKSEPARSAPTAAAPAASGSKDTSRAAKGSDGPDVIARLIERADGKPPAAPDGRKFLVQIGAYSNVQSARNMSDKAAQAGLRPYQETVKTAQGDWIRVRVGPFPTRQDAERAQQDLKRAGVTAAIIAL